MTKALTIIAVASTLAAGMAHAEWTHRPSSAADDNGGASVTNAQGHRLAIGCGNSGTIAISLTPDTRPADLNFLTDGAVVFFRVDGGEPLQMPATCVARGCFQDFMLGGSPWPVREMTAITSALRAGSTVDVMLGGQVMSRFDLSGSAGALNALQASTQCEGL
ncbi:hypothetical protein [uncultured Tateyamaria sp.]|uniref:hypothetical protein n=1 Tax=uncultured Tateyamaria sp. TaxID=455651 RepID=UPI002638E871|nr:hypothetical protein [uncultured Tateyamaria sp.]